MITPLSLDYIDPYPLAVRRVAQGCDLLSLAYSWDIRVILNSISDEVLEMILRTPHHTFYHEGYIYAYDLNRYAWTREKV